MLRFSLFFQHRCVGGQGATEAWVDSAMGIQAFKRANGEYLVAVERGYTANSVIFQRWVPGTSGPPQPQSISAESEGTRACRIHWSDVDGEANFRLEKRDLGSGGWGPWTEIAAAIPANMTTYLDLNRTTGSLAAYRVRAEAAGVKSDYSPSVYAGTHASEPPLLGRWRLDNSLSDTTGTYHASFSGGTPSYGSGYVSPGLNFDGVDDAMILPVTPDPTDYSMALWVKFSTIRKTNLWVRSQDQGPGHSATNWLRVNENGRLEYYMEGFQVSGTTVLQPNVWYHIAISAKNFGKMRLFLNGEQDGAEVDFATTMWTEGDRYYVGGNAPMGFVTPQGTIDDVRLYGRSLAPREVRSLYINTRNLVGRWKFDNTLQDDAGTTTAAFQNGVASYQPGITGAAVNLDGIDDALKMAYAPTPTQYTISFWTKLRTIRPTNFMGRTCSDGLQHCASTWAYLNGSNRFCHFESAEQVGNLTAVAGQWSHVAITGSPGGLLRLYVDGVERASPIAVGPYWPDGIGYQIGGLGCFGTFVPDGLMEDARVYGRELSSDEIQYVKDSRWE